MKCYYPIDSAGNRIGFKTPEACVYDASGTSLTTKLAQINSNITNAQRYEHTVLYRDSSGYVRAYRVDYDNFSIVNFINWNVAINGQRSFPTIDIGIKAASDARASVTIEYNNDYGYVYIDSGSNIVNFLSMRLYNGSTNMCGQLFVPTK